MDVYILGSAADGETLAAALDAADGFLSLRVGRISSQRSAGATGGVFAVAKAWTMSSPDTVLARLDTVSARARASGRGVSFELLLAGGYVWDSDVLVLPSPRLAEDDAVVSAVLEVGPDVRLPDGEPLARAASAEAVDVADTARLESAMHAQILDVSAPGPDWDAAFLWTDEGAEWVPVDAAWGWQKDVEIRLAKLLDARIPATLSTRPFADMYAWFFGSLQMARILVPPAHAEEATALLAAGFDDPEGEFGEVAEVGLEELFYERPWFQFVHWGMRLYVAVYVAQIVWAIVPAMLY